jgi:glutathione synthase/RimK-type ligase-like ATP-grasp enzyme
MSRPRVAIATCAGYENLKVDDVLLGEALRERGCEAVSIVWDRDQLDWRGFDLCLVRSTWDYHDKHPEFLAWTLQVEAGTAIHNPADVIAWNSDKTYLQELSERGVRTVPTVWVKRDSGADLEPILAQEGWGEAVVKPVVDLGAKNLHRVQAGAGEAQQALEAVLTRSNAMVQPFLPSLEAEGETSLIYIDGAFTHAVCKRPAAGDFRVQSIWGGTFDRIEPTTRQTEIAERAITELDEAPLYARVDLVPGPGGDPCLIELELIEPNLYLSTNPDAAAQLADAVLSQLS